MTRSEAKEQRREQAKLRQAAVDNPIKAFKVGTAADGSPTYVLRLYAARTGKLGQYSGTYSQLKAIYRKRLAGLGVHSAVSFVVPFGQWAIPGNAHDVYKNKQAFKQLQELAGETSSEDDLGDPPGENPPSETRVEA